MAGRAQRAPPPLPARPLAERAVHQGVGGALHPARGTAAAPARCGLWRPRVAEAAGPRQFRLGVVGAAQNGEDRQDPRR